MTVQNALLSAFILSAQRQTQPPDWLWVSEATLPFALPCVPGHALERTVKGGRDALLGHSRTHWLAHCPWG